MASISKRKVDIIVHIPLEEELREFLELFPSIEDFPVENNYLAEVMGPAGYRIGVVLQERMGRASAHSACLTAIEVFDSHNYICLGIAGGLSKDLHLGDVCYTGTLIDIYDNSKVVDGANGGLDIEFAPTFYSTDRKIVSALGFVRTLSQLKDHYEYWQKIQEGFATEILTHPVPGRADELETIGAPKCLNGDIVCGAVAESDKYRDRIKGITRKILAVETESGPIFEICEERGIKAIAIRGISDYANASKGKLEGSSQNAVRKIAARNAAAFLHMQLQNPLVSERIKRQDDTNEAPELPLGDVIGNPIPNLVDRAAAIIDARLRELSPPYKTKPKGYRLPAPRVKIDTAPTVGDQRKPAPTIEIVDAVTQYKRMLVYVPRAYPDQALPWVIAQAILDIDLGSKKAIPIVIDGSRLAYPRDTLKHRSEIEIVENIGESGGEYVFIIDNPSFSSDTRFDFLANESAKWPDAHIIYLTKSDKALVEVGEAYRSLRSVSFSLKDVSYYEMAVFLEKAFDLPAKEADVVALKLRKLFSQFSLPAHPSFFAGIPPEALSALLLANRRSELIQLAVDGVLSFVVAADKARVRMSRTNRARFLRRLVIDIAHNKKNFTRADLIAFAQNISDEFDYGINPIEFVKSFEDAGILFFQDRYVSITLPFVQSYLLADELSREADLASQYFQLPDEEFDFLTFDLYAEIGASDEIVDAVKMRLDELVDECGVPVENQLILSGAINPNLFKNPGRVSSLSRRITEARTAIASGTSDRREKASILDIADRVNDDVADKADPDERGQEESESKLDKMLLRYWMLSVILLGSGAESIRGESRRELASLIIRGGEALIEQLTRHFQSIDFNEIREKILTDQKFRTEVEIDDDEEFKTIVTALVDFVEFIAFSQPLDRVFDMLPDQARHIIVANSIEKVTGDSKVQRLIRASWLVNINHAAGRRDLNAAIADLPKVQFLRAALTSIFVSRVKWKVSDTATQGVLLDAAESLIRPYNPHYDKGEIQRFVARQKARDDANNDTESDPDEG